MDKRFTDKFSSDEMCLQEIFSRKFGSLNKCPACGVHSKMSRVSGRKAYVCQNGCHIYPCADTLFNKSSTSLLKWFYALWLIAEFDSSAKELQRSLLVTYKCAFNMRHKIKELQNV